MEQLLMRRPSLAGLPPIPPLPDGYVLREAGPADRAGLAALLGAAFDDAGWDETRVGTALLSAPDVEKTYVIERDGRALVATASAQQLPRQHPGSGVVHWVAADRAEAGKGLGYIVSLAVLHDFVRLGCRDACLRTDDQRLPAIKTYLNLGFVPEDCDATHRERWKRIREAFGPGWPCG